MGGKGGCCKARAVLNEVRRNFYAVGNETILLTYACTYTASFMLVILWSAQRKVCQCGLPEELDHKTHKVVDRPADHRTSRSIS